jgi:hypothetical protein
LVALDRVDALLTADVDAERRGVLAQIGDDLVAGRIAFNDPLAAVN